MVRYWVHLVDRRGVIESSYTVDSEDDQDALSMACRIAGQTSRLEVWEGGRLVACSSGRMVPLWWPQTSSRPARHARA